MHAFIWSCAETVHHTLAVDVPYYMFPEVDFVKLQSTFKPLILDFIANSM